MKQYIDIVEDVLENGSWKENRTGVKTLALPGVFFAHDMNVGFPLLTIRKMPIRSIAVELEGFIKGITSKSWYQKRGCKFWDGWANPIHTELEYKTRTENPSLPQYTKKEIAARLDDLGPLGYSYQLRSFNRVYDEDDNGCMAVYDQLQDIINKLKTDPNDRRMVASLWNPVQLDRMALPPCTVSWVVNVIDGKLNLSWLQRSCDIALGLPSDIASNALMLVMLAKTANLLPGRLTGLLVDAHIYENHVDNIKELIQRKPKPLPTLELLWAGMDDEERPIRITNHNCINALSPRRFDILNWNYQEIKLHNYDPHPKMEMGTIAV